MDGLCVRPFLGRDLVHLPAGVHVRRRRWPYAAAMPRTPAKSAPVAVRTSKIQGKGVFALRPFRRGEWIMDYQGELISHDEADRRYDDLAMGRHHTFLFAIDSHWVLDGAVGGDASRFINHSCEPNCEAITVGRGIEIIAMRAIAAGEELTYDYAYERLGDEDARIEKLYRCRCGSARCRGSILEPKRAQRRSAKSAAPRRRSPKAPAEHWPEIRSTATR